MRDIMVIEAMYASMHYQDNLTCGQCDFSTQIESMATNLYKHLIIVLLASTRTIKPF